MKTINFLRYSPIVMLSFLSCDDDDDMRSLTGVDQSYIQQAAISNMAEIEMATLAVSKATNGEVMNFAKHMINEHNDALSELKSIADGFQNADLPSSLDEAHLQLKQKLQGMSGVTFDSTYMRSQVNDHAAAITLFQNEQINGAEKQLKEYVNKYLPHIQEHYNTAATVLGQLKQDD